MIMIMMIICVMIIIILFYGNRHHLIVFFLHVISRPKRRLFIVGTGQSFLNEPNMNSFLRKSSFAGHWYIGQQCW